MTGHIDYKDIGSLLSECTIGISPLYPYERFKVSTPSKLVEYLSVGLPSVANNEISDQSEILALSEGGLAVDYNSTSFSNAILWLLDNSDEALKMGNKGKKWMLNNRNYKKLARDLEKKYLHTLNSWDKLGKW